MRRMNKKDNNLNSLKTGCSPCLNEAKKMENRISKKNISVMTTQKFKKIVFSIFKKD